MKLPRHINVTIEHQPHATSYQTVKEWLAEYPGEFEDADRAQMVETGEVWTIQWYPNTPVGFEIVAAASLERALELANASDPDDARPR